MTGLMLSGAPTRGTHAQGRWKEEGIAAHGPTTLVEPMGWGGCLLRSHEVDSEASSENTGGGIPDV